LIFERNPYNLSYVYNGRKNMHRSVVLTAFLLVLGAAGLSACNTVEGFGKDIQNAGEAIEDAGRK
jgi:predicted small secreted protein